MGRAAILFVALALPLAMAQADVVRCTDASGRTIYTDGACPAGSRSAVQVPIADPPPPDPRAVPPVPAATPPVAVAPPAAPPRDTRPQGPAVIPRYPVDTSASDPQPEPAYIWSDGYGYPYPPPQVRPPRPHPQQPIDNTPPGQRRCWAMAGVKRYNC